jgi:ABC-type multidrug transport system fused ATPase/permease subunit
VTSVKDDAALAAADQNSAPAEAHDEGRERSQREEIARLLPYAREHRFMLALTLVLSILLAVVDVPIPFMLRHIIDALLKKRTALLFAGHVVTPEMFLLGIFGMMASLAIFKGILVYWQRTVSETIGQRMVFAMRLDLYKQLQSLNMRWFREARTGKLMLRLMGDINAVLDMITDGYMRALMDSVTVISVLIAIFTMNWRLALIVLIAMPLYLFAFRFLNPKLRSSGKAARRERSALSGHLQEKIAGAVIVKAFVQEEAEARQVEDQTGRMRDRLIEKARWGGLLSAVANTTVALGAALVIWVGGREVLAGNMTKGALMAFYSLSLMMFPPLRRLAKTNETYQASRISLDRILDFFDETTPHLEPKGGVPLKVTRGDVTFENVSFHYLPEKPVLSNVTLHVRGGESIALVGSNGAGKTTLVNQLLRFLTPVSGRVLVDGQDLAQVDLRTLRRQVGVVTQETILFSGTILENIRYGCPEATDEQIVEAARVANAYDFIMTLPHGFQTDVGERGQRLSGGQLQRIALARAVLNNPPILILDEATSAVDAESEALIQEALARLTHGRTVFSIAHRMSTVRRSDRIVVMEHGRIVEEGRHDDLLARGGSYRKLFAEQIFETPPGPSALAS